MQGNYQVWKQKFMRKIDIHWMHPLIKSIDIGPSPANKQKQEGHKSEGRTGCYDKRSTGCRIHFSFAIWVRQFSSFITCMIKYLSDFIQTTIIQCFTVLSFFFFSLYTHMFIWQCTLKCKILRCNNVKITIQYFLEVNFSYINWKKNT
jgi:hypothetical protein